jgi:hypothetical protein
MNRPIRFLILVPVLTALWGYSNSIGVTDSVTTALGLPSANTWQIPGVERVFEAQNSVRNEVRSRAQKAAVAALRKEVTRRYGPEAAAKIPDDLSLRAARKLLAGSLSQKDLTSAIPQINLPAGGGSSVPKNPGKSGETPAPTGDAATVARQVNGTKTEFRKALATLGTLAVKGKAPKTGYDRDAFGTPWSDSAGDSPYVHNGCDMRNDVLARDLINETIKPNTHNCVVLTGVLPYDPYSGQINRPFDTSKGTSGDYALDAEHVVALEDAFTSGAWAWTPERRAAYANSPLVLTMVNPHDNRAKGGSNAAEWLPPNKPYRCAYVSRQIRIKSEWALSVTPAEKAAMVGILDGCINR